jgi:diguanylate cyclase (GGDEF)-like protein
LSCTYCDQRLNHSLTGLFNHRIFYERLKDELNRARRYDSPVSMVLIDLDNFKSVNELKGHQFGDQLLVKSAERMRADLRQTDIICRYGGDEFGVILPETAQQDAVGMMCRLAEDFKELGRKEGAPATFGMTFGLSVHPDDQGTVQHMVKAADDRSILSKKSKVGLLRATEREAPGTKIESGRRSEWGFPERKESCRSPK